LGLDPGISRPCSWPLLVERINRNFGEKRLTGAVFLDVAKAFDTIWSDGLLYKLTLLNLPSYIFHTIRSCFQVRMFKASYQMATPSPRGMRAGVAQGGSGWIDLPCYLQSVCQEHAFTLAPCRVNSLCGRRDHHSHVPQAGAARQLPGVILQRPSLVVECLENCHCCL
jgi:hypothetical protein